MNKFVELNVDSDDSSEKISAVIQRIIKSAYDFKDDDDKTEFNKTLETLGSLIFFLGCKNRLVFAIKDTFKNEINNNKNLN